jgi:group I intron endonuclease
MNPENCPPNEVSEDYIKEDPEADANELADDDRQPVAASLPDSTPAETAPLGENDPPADAPPHQSEREKQPTSASPHKAEITSKFDDPTRKEINRPNTPRELNEPVFSDEKTTPPHCPDQYAHIFEKMAREEAIRAQKACKIYETAFSDEKTTPPHCPDQYAHIFEKMAREEAVHKAAAKVLYERAFGSELFGSPKTTPIDSTPQIPTETPLGLTIGTEQRQTAPKSQDVFNEEWQPNTNLPPESPTTTNLQPSITNSQEKQIDKSPCPSFSSNTVVAKQDHPQKENTNLESGYCPPANNALSGKETIVIPKKRLARYSHHEEDPLNPKNIEHSLPKNPHYNNVVDFLFARQQYPSIQKMQKQANALINKFFQKFLKSRYEYTPLTKLLPAFEQMFYSRLEVLPPMSSDIEITPGDALNRVGYYSIEKNTAISPYFWAILNQNFKARFAENREPFGVIYGWFNKTNGKAYVGLTRNLKVRLLEHLYCQNNEENNRSLYKAIRNEGLENFTFEIIDIAFSVEELNQKETFWGDIFDVNNPDHGYNMFPLGKSYERTPAAIKNVFTLKEKQRKAAPVSTLYSKGRIKWLNERYWIPLDIRQKFGLNEGDKVYINTNEEANLLNTYLEPEYLTHICSFPRVQKQYITCRVKKKITHTNFMESETIRINKAIETLNQYRSGKSWTQISKELALSKKTIEKWRTQFWGDLPRNNPYTDAEMEKIKNFATEYGLTQAGRQYQLHPKTIMDWVKQSERSEPRQQKRPAHAVHHTPKQQQAEEKIDVKPNSIQTPSDLNFKPAISAHPSNEPQAPSLPKNGLPVHSSSNTECPQKSRSLKYITTPSHSNSKTAAFTPPISSNFTPTEKSPIALSSPQSPPSPPLTNISPQFAKYPFIPLRTQVEFLKAIGFSVHDAAALLGYEYTLFCRQLNKFGYQYQTLPALQHDLPASSESFKSIFTALRADVSAGADLESPEFIAQIHALTAQGFSNRQIEHLLSLEPRFVSKINPLRIKPTETERQLIKQHKNDTRDSTPNAHVRKNGHFKWKGKPYFLSWKLAYTPIYIRENPTENLLEIYSDSNFTHCIKKIQKK